MATCSNCGNTTTKCGCKDTPLTTPPSYTCPPNDSCPDPTPCFETIQDTCVVHSLNYGLPCLGVTAGMTLEQILQLINNTINNIGDGSLTVSDEGSLVENETTSINFTGPLVEATSAGANTVEVNVSGDLVADLDDVNQNGFSSLSNLGSNITFDFLASPPSAVSTVEWILDIVGDKELTYGLIYDPVAAVWRPMNIGFLINSLVCTLYSNNGFLSGDREVGFNNSDIIFTDDVVTDCEGNSSTKAGGRFIVKSADIGTDSGPEQTFYSPSYQRLNHVRIYNDLYTPYATWLASGSSVLPAELRSMLVGFFSDAYSENTLQSQGYERTPAETEINFFSNPISTGNATEAYSEDGRIVKKNDQYDSTDQATRVITGGGDMFIVRSSPASQHAGTDEVGLGSIYLLHGGNPAIHPYSEFQYTGQYLWNKYGVGTFQDTPAYLLGTTAAGNIIEVTGSSVQQSLITTVESYNSTIFNLDNADKGKLIRLNSTLPITLNVPTDSTPIFPGSRFEFVQWGVGVVTITPAIGVTLNSRGGLTDSNGQYAKFELIKTASGTWLASGDLA